MKNHLSTYSTEDLLRMSRQEDHSDSRFSYDAIQHVHKRWRDGIDVHLLVALLESKVTSERSLGAYYLMEAIPRSGVVKGPAIRLAEDSVADCRRAFVQYMTNSGLYDEAIAVGLAKCMLDSDLRVRLETINWAVYTTDDRFEELLRLVESGSGATDSATWRKPQMRRGLRGISIARRLRDGESVAEIRKSMPEEDSYTFDHFQVFESRVKRYNERRKIGATTPVATEYPGMTTMKSAYSGNNTTIWES